MKKLFIFTILILSFQKLVFAEPVAHTPPLPGEPTHMTVNYTLSTRQVIAFEIFWDKENKVWKGLAAGEEFPVVGLPDKEDKRFKIYETDWCGCDCGCE